MLQNGTRIDHEVEDGCPVHGGEVKKCYSFGREEADVYVFHGCKCACCERHDPVGIDESVVTYHPSYNLAAGEARLHTALATAKYGC